MAVFERKFVMGLRPYWTGLESEYGEPNLTNQLGYYVPRHGCSVEIGLRRGDRISHLSGVTVTYPTVRSYPDGIKVGCSFITNEAIERLYKWHKDFLGREESRTHQSGD
jgi:hypothetical protein